MRALAYVFPVPPAGSVECDEDTMPDTHAHRLIVPGDNNKKRWESFGY